MFRDSLQFYRLGLKSLGFRYLEWLQCFCLGDLVHELGLSFRVLGSF